MATYDTGLMISSVGDLPDGTLKLDAASGHVIVDDSGGGGSGTVTSVDASGSQGVTVGGVPITTSGTITIGLGAITPLSVASVGAVTGSNLSGTNTGDQTITLTSDVTGSGTGSFATTIANNAVTYAKMQAVSTTSRLLGSSSTTTAVQEITLGSGLSLTGTTLSATGSGGTVTSVDVSGGTTGLTTSGGPVTGSGIITIAGTLAIANGGTGQTTAGNAINALLPTQTGHSGEFLTTNGTVASWAAASGGGVTSITGTANQVIASAPTGAVTLSTPQDIATSSTPQFAQLGLGAAADATAVILTNKSTATTNAGVNTGLFQLNSSGTAADNFGQIWKWQLETSTTNNTDAAQILIDWRTATHASRTSRMRFYTVNSASALTEVMQFGNGFSVLFPQQAQGVLTIQSGGTLTSNTLAGASVIYASGTGSITGNATTFTYGTSAGLLASASNIGAILRVTPATNNALTDGAAVDNINTGSSANGLGTGLIFRGKTSTTSSVDLVRVGMVQTDVTHATRTAALVFSGVNNAAAIAEWARLKNGVLTVGVAGTLIGQLQLTGNTSGTITITPAAAAGTQTYTIRDQGAAANFVLSNVTGANASAGQATLVLGTIVVNTTFVAANSLIFLTDKTASNPVSVGAIVAGVSFVINGTGADVINWFIINQ